MHRRDFVKTMAISGIAVAASDLVGDLIAQTPSGKPLESRFKGLSDIALAEARTQGCSYADIRFTTHARLRRTAARHGLELEDVTDEALATQLDRYDSGPGRLAGRAVRLLPGAIRRRALDLGSPQWFFFVRHRGGA